MHTPRQMQISGNALRWLTDQDDLERRGGIATRAEAIPMISSHGDSSEKGACEDFFKSALTGRGSTPSIIKDNSQ